MFYRELLREALSVPWRQISFVQMMPDLVHQNRTHIKPTQPIQVSSSKWISVKKHTIHPVLAVTCPHTAPAFQLLLRSGQNEDGPQSSQEFDRTASQLSFHLHRQTGSDETLQCWQLDDLRIGRPLGNLSIKTPEDRLNLQPPGFIFRPVRKPILRVTIGPWS